MLALEPDSDPIRIAIGYRRRGAMVVSSSGGAGEFRNAVLRQEGASFAVISTLCGASVTCALGDVATDYILNDVPARYPLVFERDAENRIVSPLSSSVPFTAPGLIASTAIAGFSPAGTSGYLAVTSVAAFPDLRSMLLVAGSDDNGATSGIYGASALRSVASEASPASAPARLSVFPNPSAGRASVRLVTEIAMRASVEVADVLGRRVAVLHDGPLAAGEHTFALSPGLALVVYAVRTGAEARTFTVVR